MSSNSSTGQILGYVVGAVVGYFTGGTGWALVGNMMSGAAAGGAVGGMLDPPKGPTLVGPRLGDLSVQTSTYGAHIPRIYGSVATMGNIFWLEGDRLKETLTKKKSGGKGGGGSTVKTYSYSATFAVGLCEGPIAGVRRIWVGAKLIYDAGSDDVESIIASNQAATSFRVYLGTEDQQPDPRMQADKGVANTPAYRGLAYIVMYDYPLKEHGNSLMGAQAKVEVVGSGGLADELLPSIHPAGLPAYYSVASYLGMVVAGSGGEDAALSIDGGRNYAQLQMPAIANAGGWVVGLGKRMFFAIGEGSAAAYTAWSEDGRGWARGDDLPPLPWRAALFAGERYVAIPQGGSLVAVSLDARSWAINASALPSKEWSGLAHTGTSYVTVTYNDNLAAVSLDAETWVTYPLPSSSNWLCVAYGDGALMAGGATGAIAVSLDDGVTWSAATGLPGSAQARWITHGDDVFVASGPSAAYYSEDDGASWALITGASGSVCYNGGWFIFAGSGAGSTWRRHSLYQSDVSTGDVFASECAAQGALSAIDFDASGLVDLIRGYRITQTGAIRAAIEPLQSAWPFDVIQSGYKIKAVPRGGASVATIPADLLDARAAGEAPGPQITIVREMDTQLPRRVSIKHMDINREYDIGEQYAERGSGESISVREMEMPIVFNGQEAAQKAEVLLYLYWLERHTIQLKIPPEYLGLQPADVITITATDATYELRLTNINYLSDGRLECVARYNSAAIYTSTATGESSTVVGGVVGLAGPSKYELLDIPALRSEMDAPLFVAAMTGYTAAWPGGIIFRSSDGGQSWDDLQGWTGKCTMGSARNALTAHPGSVIDAASVLQVDLLAGELDSITELAMLNGGNHFAYGAHGRWEIIAAKNCVVQGDGSYYLADLLRGRFGTEHNTGAHAVGDVVILLNDPDLALIGMDSASIGLARSYRGITAGQTLDSDADRSFTYSGVNLECLSPVYLNGDRDPATNDWTLTWVRRTRIGGEWRDLVDAPLSESSESYQVEIFASSGYAAVVRTFSASTPSIIYTGADQFSDFGGFQDQLYVRVYQMSATVGRGFPLQASISKPYVEPVYPAGSLSLLAHYDDADGATAIVDEAGYTITAHGSAQIDTAQSVFGGSSVYIGTTSDYLSSPGSARFDVTSSESFAFEMRVRRTTASAFGELFYFGPSHLRAYVDNQGRLTLFRAGSLLYQGPAVNNTENRCSIPANTWCHLEFSQDVNNGYFYVFIRGHCAFRTTTLTSLTCAATVYIAGAETPIGALSGWVDEQRFIKNMTSHTYTGPSRPAYDVYVVDTDPFPNP